MLEKQEGWVSALLSGLDELSVFSNRASMAFTLSMSVLAVVSLLSFFFCSPWLFLMRDDFLWETKVINLRSVG